MTTVPLAKKLDTIYNPDSVPGDALATCHQQPHMFSGQYLGEYEQSLRAWGLMFGIAFGIARCEDPWESVESVAARAYEAAWPKFLEFTAGGFEERQANEAAREVVKVYRAGITNPTTAPPMTDELATAIEALGSEVGT